MPYINPIAGTYLNRTPYTSVSEYQAAPSALDTSNLWPGGSEHDQNSALAGIIDRASGFIDTWCYQVLAATVNTESEWVRVRSTPNGTAYIPLLCANKPVLELTSLSYGLSPSVIEEATPIEVWFETGLINASVARTGLNGGSGTLYAQWSYVNGWPHTQLATAAEAGDTTIQVDGPVGAPTASPYGIYAGSQLQMVSGPLSETIVVASVSGTTLTLVSPLLNDYPLPESPDFVAVTGLPLAVRQAAISWTSVLIKARGNGGLVLESIAGNAKFDKFADDAASFDDWKRGEAALRPYRRVV